MPGLSNCPPTSTPRMMEVMVSPSIQPLALTSWEAGSNSVRIAVLGRRVWPLRPGPHGVGDQRVVAEQHHQAAHDLDRIADEHHPPLGQGVGKGADEGGQDHVEQREHGHQGGALPLGAPLVRSSSTAVTTGRCLPAS